MAEDVSVRRAPRGTKDILPPESWRWRQAIELALRDVFPSAGYAPVETPMFEHTEVFRRGVGATSEVVGKQMYTFADRGGRSLTLRPEGTAPIMRAVLEHGLERGPLPVKLGYAGPMFRQERPQRGRYREFWQVGIEAIGSDRAATDAEVIEIGRRYLQRAGVTPALLINSIGHLDRSCRLGYLDALSGFLAKRTGDLAPEDRARIETNPLRTFDSKESATVQVMEEAPVISDHLCDGCAEHFQEVQRSLDDLGIDFSLDARLVRGLDYYTRTAFEFVAPGLGSQNAVGGGGRYDGLSESLGGPALPAIGFALGVDRILLASRDRAAGRATVVYVVALGEAAARAALKLATELRRAEIGSELDLMGRAMRGQLKDAARSGARWAAIIGEEELSRGEVTLKDLATSEQRSVASGDLVATVARGLGES
jgi:histidyl-tRNA synthetase